MKLRLSLLFLILFAFASCRHQNQVVESTYPDGSPKRVCVYLGSGERKELIRETCYYKNKKVQVNGEYRKGQRNGKWTYYYETGIIWSDGFFRAGKSDGKRMTYFPSGKVRYEAHYRDDKRVGIWKFYNEEGKLMKSVDYSKGEASNSQESPDPGK